MNFAGIQKLTLLDYPGKTACTLFTDGCNLRCPFCHNARLVLPEMRDETILSGTEIHAFLKKRAGLLDGVCITGGEPLLHIRELLEFLPEVRSLGYAVKLDTNGTRPDALERLLRDGLIDYAAMDVKNAFPYYGETVGLPDFDVTPVKESIALLMQSGIDYEFRTTVVREFHTVERIRELAESITGAKRYFLQGFKDSGELIADGLSAVSREEMEKMRDAANRFCPTELRGM
ncbi:MAG: anaerobic ribonucleoside-triphosphate reductase activating protein [Clostridia bacterium]|nr:anaerobic ribonucleoside-triphosphate reductase activating protein [Clostridia bacterium]